MWSATLWDSASIVNMAVSAGLWHASRQIHDRSRQTWQVTCDTQRLDMMTPAGTDRWHGTCITCSSPSSAYASLHIHPCRTWAGWADGPYASSILCKHDNSAFNSMLLVTCYVPTAFCLFTTFSRVVHGIYLPGHSRESQFNIHTSFCTRLHKRYTILLHKQ